MRISRLHVCQFGHFNDYEIRFQSGLNVIKGPNEAGKSTLHRGIMMALLERPNHTKPNERYCNWGAKDWYQLQIEFYVGNNGPYRLSKDFNNRTQQLDNSGGRSIDTFDKLQSFLDKNIGTSSSNIFESTVCVIQDELSELSKGQKEISRSLEGIITGGNENSYALDSIKKLNDKIIEYNRGVMRNAPTNPGPIARLSAEKAELEKRVQRYDQEFSGRKQDQIDFVEKNEKIKEIEAELNTSRPIKEKADKAHKLWQELDRLIEKESELDGKIKLVNQTDNDIAQASRTLQEIQSTSKLSERNLQEIRELQDEINRISIPPRLPGLSSYILPALPLLVGFLMGAAGIFLRNNQAFSIALILGGIFLTGLAIYLLFRTYQRRHVVEEQNPSGGFRQQSNSLEDIQQQLKEQLAPSGFSSIEELDRALEREANARQARTQAQQRMAVLLPSSKNIQTLSEELRTLRSDIRRRQEQMEEPGYQRIINLSPEQYQELEDKIARSEKTHEDLKQQQQRIQGRLERVTTSRDDLLDATERLNVVDEELLREQEQLEVYKLASKIMKEAREATLARASDEIAPRLGNYLKSLTLGRYDSVLVDSELNIRIKHPTIPDYFIEPQSLSRGTQDQLYLSARLAIIDLIFGDTNPPIFLDDPFVKFDPERLSAAITLCQTIAKERQVLLFTCSDHYDFAGHVITINQPASKGF